MTASEKRAKAVALMKSRAGKNSYTQGSNRKYFFGKPDNIPGNTTQKGYSDCSSAVRKAIQAAAGIDIGGNTNAQIRNRSKGIIVDQTDGYYPDESRLIPGDCLYFKGNTAHTLDVGHVEMYTGENECTGHGSGTGPKIKNLRSYCKGRGTNKRRYFMAIRWIKDDGDTSGGDGFSTLRRGSEGNDVAILQGNLLSLGYSLGKWGADGDFGAATENAVKAFQDDRNLPLTGVVDEATARAIAAAMEPQGDADSDVEQPEPPQHEGDLTVKPKKWNLRTGPGTQYDSAGTVNGGTKLVEAKVDGWIPVMVDGEVRWISEKAIEG